jgi:inosose dehydratase
MDQLHGGAMNRRDFAKALALGIVALPGCASAAVSSGQAGNRLVVGHTGITWGFSPDDAPEAIQDIGSLGYHGMETFPNVIEAYETRGGIGQLLAAANLPLVAAYCGVNLTNAAVRADEVAKIVRWGQLIRKYGGTVAVIGPNGTQRNSYDFNANRANIVAALNDMGKALMDVGIVGALHPHTGTTIETAEEARAVMESVDSRYVKFGPDVGQLQKAGSDPVPLVRDFASIIHHVHMKDYDGGPAYLGYAPLGRGQVRVAEIAQILEGSGVDMMIMVELDAGGPMPLTPRETARVSREYLETLGYEFRTPLPA